MEATYARDEVLSGFEAIWLQREHGVQPSSMLLPPKQLVRDVVISAYRAFESHELDLRLVRNAEETCRFQTLTIDEADAVNEVERERDFPGGSATNLVSVMMVQALNARFAPVIKAEREALYSQLEEARKEGR